MSDDFEVQLFPDEFTITDGSDEWVLVTPVNAEYTVELQAVGANDAAAAALFAAEAQAAALAAEAAAASQMQATMYDPQGIQADAFARANHTGTQSADTLTDGVTNKAFLATERTKLAGIAVGATANQTDAFLLARANHTGTQSADTLTDGATNKAFLATERTKLAGIAVGATANQTDAFLLARANHTGTQLAATISDFNTSADARVAAAVGVSVQAHDADLDSIAALATTAYGRSLLTKNAAEDVRSATGTPPYVISIAALKALDTTKDTIAVYDGSIWKWTLGDFSTQIAADTAEGIYVKATAIAATVGAWVRKYGGFAFARWFGSGQAAIEAAHAVVDDIEIDQPFAITATNSWPKGKRYKFTGLGKLSVATAVILTIAGVVNAPTWAALPTAGPNKIFDCTGTGKVLGLCRAHPEWWGAKGDGVTDDKVACQAAHDCIEGSTGSDGNEYRLQLRAGATYGLATSLHLRPSANLNLKVLGAGPIFGTRFKELSTFTTGSGNAVIFVDGQTVGTTAAIAGYEIGNFSIEGNATGGALVGMRIGGDGIATTGTDLIGVQQNQIRDVFSTMFEFGFRIANCRLIDFNRCSAWCDTVANSVGCYITVDTATAFTGDLNFNDCQFVADPANSRKCVFITSAISGAQIKGIRFNSTIFYKGDRYLDIYAVSGGIIGDIWVNPGCQFDGFGNTAVHIEANGATSVIDSIHVIGTYIRGINAAGIGIDVRKTSSGQLRDFHFDGNQIFSLSAGATAIFANGVSGIHIDGNQITDIDNTTGQAIYIQACTRASVCGNILNKTGSQQLGWFVTVDACDYYTVVGNIGAGIVSTAVVREVTPGANKVVIDQTGALFAAGAALNFNNGNYTVTHTAGLLTFSGYVLVAGDITSNLNIRTNGPGAGIGYATGAGGTVTQATSKSTGVTLNKATGQITMNAAALAASTTVSFVLTNSAIAATDIILLNHISGGTAGSYTLNARAAAVSATIDVRNVSLGSLSEAIVISYALVKAVTA